MTLANPLTGVVIPDNLPALEAEEAKIDTLCRGAGPLFEYRRALRVRIAELRGPAELPRPRFRSDKQSRVASCPRCGDSL